MQEKKKKDKGLKYIRTKDGIYDKIDESLMFASKPPKYQLTKNGEIIGYELCRNCILADTIEELCDEFVQINKSKDKDLVRIKKIDGVIYYQKLERTLDSEWHKLSAGEYIIGSIWTDKGLIYKAVMKGVLPNGEIDWELI